MSCRQRITSAVTWPFINRWKSIAGILLIYAGYWAWWNCLLYVPQQDLPKLTFIKGKKDSGPIILFVHGLVGDGIATWTNTDSDAGTYWPNLVAKDKTFEDASVAVYSYGTCRCDSLTIDEHVRQLHQLLQYENIQDREFIFVAHSLGGLIVRRYLLSPDAKTTNVRFICYYGTPFSGASIARYGSLFSNNATIKQMQFSPGEHSWLDEQHAQWGESDFRDVAAWTFYETAKYLGVLVVDQESCTRARSGIGRIVPITGNHLTICKPLNETSSSHTALVNAFNRTTTKLCKQSVKNWPTQDECKALVQQEMRTAQELFNPAIPPAGSKTDVVVNIRNRSRRQVGVVFCDATLIYDERSPETRPEMCGGFDFGGADQLYQDKYLSRFANPKGWFLVFLRYRDENEVVKDEPFGLHYLFRTLTPHIEISRTPYVDKPFSITVYDKPPKEPK